MLDRLDAIRIVLVRTSHPGNIGAAARAMLTMGLRRLELVAPLAFPHPESVAMAAGADAVLDAAPRHQDLGAALAPCHYALGCTARPRGVALPALALLSVLAACGGGSSAVPSSAPFSIDGGVSLPPPVWAGASTPKMPTQT